MEHAPLFSERSHGSFLHLVRPLSDEEAIEDSVSMAAVESISLTKNSPS